MGDKEMMKMAVIAGASYAMRYKEEHPRATETDVMNYVAGEIKKIIHELEKEWGDI